MRVTRGLGVSFCGHETMLRSLALYKLIHLFPVLQAFLFFEKTALRKIRVSGNVQVIQCGNPLLAHT